MVLVFMLCVSDTVMFVSQFVIAVVLVFVAQMVAGVLAFVMLDKVENSMMDFVKEAITAYHTPGATVDEALDTLQSQVCVCACVRACVCVPAW